MLSKPDLLLIDAKLLQKQVNPSKEVPKRLIINHSLSDRLADSLLDCGSLPLLLDPARKELKGDFVGDFFEARVVLLERVDEVFDFGHEEFADAEETGTGGDLIAEGFADGGRGEGHAKVVEFEELGEGEELTLCGFGAEVPGEVAAGADGGREHEVEGDRGFEGSAGDGVGDFMLYDKLTEFDTVVVVNLSASVSC